MNIITQFFSKLLGSQPSQLDIKQELLRKESEIGRQLFGPIPPGTKRDFFRLDTTTWVWHEESPQGVRNTKYMVRPKEIVKSVNGGHYQPISQKEAHHLLKAAELYVKRTDDELYKPVVGDIK